VKSPTAAAPSDSRRDVAATVATAIVCLGCIAGPLALGGTHPLAIAGLNAGMAIVTCLWAAFFQPSRLQLAIPLAVFLGALLQLVPLPDGLLLRLAPISAGAWKVAHEGLPSAWGRISIDPAETAAAARHGLLAMGTVAAVCSLSLRPAYRKCIIATMALSGATIWILGLLFPVKVNSFTLLGFIDFRGPLMPGRTPIEPPYATAAFGYPDLVQIVGRQYRADSWVVGDGFGPYLITNHFAGALTLTIPMLASIWLAITRNRLPTWIRVAAVVVLFAGVCATLALLVKSRAGTASFLLAAIAFGCFAARPGAWRTIMATMMIGSVAVAIGFIVVLFGPFHSIAKFLPLRFQPSVTALLTDGRIVACHVAERMFLASPLLGTGLGTYGDLYPRMVRDGSPWYFAHNEYAQLLAEAGIAGLLFLGAVSYLLVRSAMAFWRNAAHEDRILGAAAWAAVAGILMHSCFDWNLRVPANGFLAWVATGLALATGLPSPRGSELPAARDPLRAALAAALILAVLAVAAFQLRDSRSESVQRELRKAITAARLHAADPKSPSPQESLLSAIANGKRMTKWDPADAQLAATLGQAFLHLATLPIPMDEVDEALRDAEAWFQTAHRNCAVCRGIAEPTP
jgi:hypothetical protein